MRALSNDVNLSFSVYVPLIKKVSSRHANPPDLQAHLTTYQTLHSASRISSVPRARPKYHFERCRLLEECPTGCRI
jgi:hypothetical protein